MRSQCLDTLAFDEVGDGQMTHGTAQLDESCDTSPAHQALEDVIEELRVNGTMPSRQVDQALATIGTLTTSECVDVLQRFHALKPTESHAAIISEYEAESSGVRFTDPLPEHRL